MMLKRISPLKPLMVILASLFALIPSFAQDELTETITHKNVTVQYPQAWRAGVSASDDFVITNTNEIAYTYKNGSIPKGGIPDDAIAIVIFSFDDLMMFGVPADADPEAVIEIVRQNSEVKPETVTLGEWTGLRLEIPTLQTFANLRGELIALDIDGNTVVLLVTSGAEVSTDDEDTAYTIIANLSYASEDEATP